MDTGSKKLFDEIISEIKKVAPPARLVMFGANLTGELVYNAVKNKQDLTVDFFIDSNPRKNPFFQPKLEGIKVLRPEEVNLDEKNQLIVFTAHPRWYEQMKTIIRQKYKKIKILELLSNQPIYEKVQTVNRSKWRKDNQYRQIKMVIESQPRSGTNFLTFSLIEKLHLAFASTFKYTYTRTQHKIYDDIYYREPVGPLIVYSHFFKPVNRYVAEKYPVVYPIRYIFDSYYSWCYLDFLRQQHGKGPYFLSCGTKEWEKIKKHIPLNKSWLNMIRDKIFLRYEDWELDPQSNIDKLKSLVPEVEPDFFDVKVNKDRLYYTGDYRSRMDEEVYRYLMDNFHDIIQFYWPEKSNDTY